MGFGFRVLGLCFVFWGFVLWVLGGGFKVFGVSFWIEGFGLEFWVKGLGLWVLF